MAVEDPNSLVTRAQAFLRLGQEVLQPALPAHAQKLRRHISKEAIVFDIGAGAGAYARFLAGLADGGQVYAFETRPEAFWVLQRIGPLVGGQNIRALHNEFLPTLSEEGEGLTLDRFIADMKISHVDFIRLAAGGAVDILLQGAMQALDSFKPTLLMELPEAPAVPGAAPYAQVWASLVPLGYRATRLNDGTPAPMFQGPGDYLFVAEDPSYARRGQTLDRTV